MPKSYPKVRPNWPPNPGKNTVVPGDGYLGSVVVEFYIDDQAHNRMRIALYVEQPGENFSATYNVKAVGQACLEQDARRTLHAPVLRDVP